MRLKRLELQGFKSFLDRTILTFQPGVTGVVGPNGCGKSNIVDAILWVMGEQSPKHLRGDSMTDVIFSGSEHKAATSMAEVSLVLEREGLSLSPQFSAFDKGEEISVTRRVYRDGAGEFLINKTACRLKDIHELFMDTGVGRRAYSIIEQGQIDRMINVKPEDRRYIFEEVAGITKYKTKRKEAERKLDQTQQNMLRLQDILTELEKQIRSLKVQATRARKYKELKGELETVDLFLLGRSLHSHRASLLDLQTRRESLVALRSESDATFAQMDAQVTELEILRLDQEAAYQALSNQERELSLRVQKFENQVSIFEERKKYLSLSNEESQQEEAQLLENAKLVEEEIESQRVEREVLEVSLRAIETEISESEQKLRTQQERRFRFNQQRDSLLGKKNQIGQKTVSLQNQRQFAESKERECLDDQAELHQKLTDTVVQLESQKDALADADTKIEACAARSAQASAEVAESHGECDVASRRLTEVEEDLFKLREEFHGQRSRLQSLTELQENLEGYSPTAREILLKLEGVSATPLAEIVQPDQALEEHLEILLGADMNTLVVKTTAEAESLARTIQSRGLERVRVLALEELPVGEAPSTIEGTTPLWSRVKIVPGYEAAARWKLGNTFICDDVDAVFSLRQRFPDSTFLALDSRTIGHGDRSLASGSTPTKVGVFARRREIEELSATCGRLEAELTALAQQRETQFQYLQSQEKRHAELKDRLSSLHIESVEARKEREKVQLELSRTDRDYMGLSAEAERISAQLDKVRAQIELADDDLRAATEEQAAVGLELEETERALVEASRDFENLGAGLGDKKIERSRLGEKRNSLEYKLEKLRGDFHQFQERAEIRREQRERDEKELLTIDEDALKVRLQMEQAAVERNESVVQISDMKESFNDTTSNLQRLRDEKTELQKRRENVLGEIQDIDLKYAQQQASYEHLKGLSIERYHREAAPLDESAGLDLTAVPLFADAVGETWAGTGDKDREILLQEHLKSLKEKIGRYGEVNLTAIQEFDEIQKRYDFLMEQKADLENSIRILQEAIQKIDESTKVRFQETFEAVNSKFTEIFPILFNGGKAELTLTEAENVLDAGVDIMVQPPGKRLQSITLLSGGEKALTAVSLVLSIFARKPSPFCLLDEVDAPLDDANVSRFNTVVRKMAEKTQFIVITHNKKTMEIAEALYGVTMEKAGISKMTSVRLN